MKYIVTGDEMKEYDNNTITQIGIHEMVLMERAALAVHDVIWDECKVFQKILIVAGTGNNGADGLALARLFAENECDVEVCLLGNQQKATEQFRKQLEILSHYPVFVWEKEGALQKLVSYAQKEVKRYGIIVDALFGVGLSRKITGEFAAAIEAMNALQGDKIAVDMPSGICANTGRVMGVAFRADITVTFGFGKLGLYLYPGSDYAGQLEVEDIGISKRAFFGREPEWFCYTESPFTFLPERRRDGNKGTFGKVLVIAGFEQMAGAAVLCARAALELGAGMVKVICGKENREILQKSVPEVLYGTCEDLESSIKWADVVAIGPGLGKSEQASQLLQQVLKECTLPLVLDADALNLISESAEKKALLQAYQEPKILTPHIGELARLCGLTVAEIKENVSEVAKQLAKEYHSVMVCKDARTIVSGEGEKLYLNLSGNDGMATAGSGDVLTGMIAALLAQSMERREAFRAACTGVYLHGWAGEAAKVNYTEYGVTASRIIENIKRLFR